MRLALMRLQGSVCDGFGLQKVIKQATSRLGQGGRGIWAGQRARQKVARDGQTLGHFGGGSIGQGQHAGKRQKARGPVASRSAGHILDFDQ